MKTVTAIRKLRFTDVETTKYKAHGAGCNSQSFTISKTECKRHKSKSCLLRGRKAGTRAIDPHCPETKKGRDGHPTMQWFLVQQALTNRRMTPWQAH